MKLQKIHWHYVLLLIGIVLIVGGAYFMRYDEINGTELMIGIYLSIYALLYIWSHHSFRKRGQDFDQVSKKPTIFSLKKLVYNFIAFFVAIFIVVPLLNSIIVMPGSYIAPVNLILCYILMVYFIGIPAMKYLLQDKYNRDWLFKILIIGTIIFIYLAYKYRQELTTLFN